MKVSQEKIDFLFFYAVLADLLFFPYIRSLGISLSMLLVPLWFLIRIKVTYLDKEDVFCLIAIILAVLSYAIGVINYSDVVILGYEGYVSPASAFLPNTAIIIFAFLYFVFFKKLIIKYQFSINKILAFYFFFILVLCSIYFYNFSLFFEIRSFWTLGNTVIQAEELDNTYRFTSTMSDPNNFTTVINAILAFVLMNDSVKSKYKLISIPLTFFYLVGAMSSSGFAIFILVVFVYFIKNMYEIKSVKSIFTTLVVSFFSIFSFIAIFMYIKDTKIGMVAFDRVESNSLDSRFDIWNNVFNLQKILNSFFYGDGGLAIINNAVINPHSGHLHLIYNYGIIFYVIFLLVFFRIRKNKYYFSHLFMVPIFLGFTVNVGVYELRFVGVMAILTASLYIANYRPTDTRTNNLQYDKA